MSDTATPGSDQPSLFTRFASSTSNIAGSSGAFLLAFITVIVWAVAGPFVGYSETWQLLINTGTTIITFLMVFVIQASQNRDTVALHLKLNELIKATEGARNTLLGIDKLDTKDMERMRESYQRLSETRDQADKAIDEETP